MKSEVEKSIHVEKRTVKKVQEIVSISVLNLSYYQKEKKILCPCFHQIEKNFRSEETSELPTFF